VAGKIVSNMVASLSIPTATSVRTISAKILSENRALLNEHLMVRAYSKASFTHILAFALVKAMAEYPAVQSSYVEVDGKAHRYTPAHVNLGIAIDVPTPKGRMLVVPSLKAVEALNFKDFYGVFDDAIQRGRVGKLTGEDFKGTSFTLTNPGGFGTSMSVPRLMVGQGVIIAAGSIGVPPEMGGLSKEALADMAIGPVMTITSTYDHRVVQGAESGLMLKRVDELLQGADNFYDEIFESYRVPWTPAKPSTDLGLGRDPEATQVSIWKIINAYRSRGHQIADLDPLYYRPEYFESLDPASYGLTVWDLDRTFHSGGIGNKPRMTLREILALLRRAYCRRWTVEYMHITDRDRKLWIRSRVEETENRFDFEKEDRKAILTLLSRAENFERFLHTRYVGNKRFSLEGADTMIPALSEILERAAFHGVEKVVIGMAHRGRLNVLVNIMGKSYQDVFREFEAVLLPLSEEGSGDVKYHLGQRGKFASRSGKEIEVILSSNPSHLEAVDPVVCGMTRAFQDEIGDKERKKVLAVLIHGDAAFAGQGVVPETFNMSELRSFRNGGTVHLVVNNQIGFTASPRDLHSTHFCTDVAKGVEAPIMHANGDFPEAVLRSSRVAVDYSHEFGADSVIDMVCYRRWGHNEGDEPAYTQPLLYAQIAKMRTVRVNYTRLSIRRGTLTEVEAAQISADVDEEMRIALEEQRAEPKRELTKTEVLDMTLDDERDYAPDVMVETGCDKDRLVQLIDKLNTVPEGFVTHPNLLRQLRRRESMVRGEKNLDWGCAEALAFGTLVQDGVSIRLSGQDVGRGTFSHRHAVIRDQVSDVEHVPLRHLAEDGGTFEVWNSLLSEEAVLGFEYGYSLARPGTIVIWEAQFGDFANGAQVMMDQFIASGESKWKQKAGLVLLLPHGYDGQGPEHSSARPERYLGLCSAGNMTIANCTTAGQFFHLLRRHGQQEVRRPLIVFTPKSLLRDKRAATPIEELTTGGFKELILDDSVIAKDVRRVLLCSGKVYNDLNDHRNKQEIKDVAILRLEQLYPFPRRAILDALASYNNPTVTWVQETPRNMGPWSFILQRFYDMDVPIRYAGRPENSSTATGSHSRHLAEQAHLVEMALGG
jgi:2-oxoglutarate decarboxylase